MTPQEVTHRSKLAVGLLASMPCFHRSLLFLSYVSSKDNEVDTHTLIRDLLARRATVLVPVTQPGRVLVWSQLHELEDLAPGRFGILEPKQECLRLVPPPKGGVVIVPGVVFSTDCRRIGYGGGYFDRFLAQYEGTSIGLAFDCQIADDWVSEPHDIPVDFVVTESQLFTLPTPRTRA